MIYIFLGKQNKAEIHMLQTIATIIVIIILVVYLVSKNKNKTRYVETLTSEVGTSFIIQAIFELGSSKSKDIYTWIRTNNLHQSEITLIQIDKILKLGTGSTFVNNMGKYDITNGLRTQLDVNSKA